MKEEELVLRTIVLARELGFGTDIISLRVLLPELSNLGKILDDMVKEGLLLRGSNGYELTEKGKQLILRLEHS